MVEAVAAAAEVAAVAGRKGHPRRHGGHHLGAAEAVADPVDAAAAVGGLVHLRGLRCHAWPIEDAAAAAEEALSLLCRLLRL